MRASSTLNGPNSLNTWQATWRLVHAHPFVFAASTATWLVVLHAALVLGLVSRMIFDHLTQGAPLAEAPWIWIMLIVAARMVRVTGGTRSRDWR